MRRPMHLPPHWHPAVGPADVLVYAGGSVAVWFGGAVYAAATAFDFNGLAGLVVALTGLVGMLGGLWTNAQKNRLEEVKIGAAALRATVEAQAAEIALLRRRTHDLANSQQSTALKLEVATAKGLTPDPDRSGPLEVVVKNDESHPVPTVPRYPPPAGGPHA